LQVPLKLEGVRLDIDASIGITLYPEHGKDAQILLQRADVAMYQAKQKHCGFIMYTTALDRCNTRRLTLMGELREAIINNELVAYYQPKIDIKTGKIKEPEALVRWKHKVHGLVQPDDFIPMQYLAVWYRFNSLISIP